MTILQQTVQAKRSEILRLAAQRGATRVRIFGSVVHGKAESGSDLDLLVAFEPNRSLLDLIGLKQDLQDLLGRDVDIVSENGVSPYLRDRILQDAQPL